MSRGRHGRVVLAGLFVGGVALAVLGPGGCTPAEDPWAGAGSKPRVLVSFAPLYCFVRNVGGDDVAVKSLLSSRGPHDYPYDPHDLLPLKKADLFLINGLSLDDGFAEKLANNSGNGKLKLVKLGDVAIPKDQRLELNVKHGSHYHQGDDPHVWLGLPEAIAMVQHIAAELKALDPEHAAAYDRRAGEYVEKLRQLHDDGRQALPGKPEDKRIVTTHDAFQYFARSFDVEIVGYIQSRAGHGIDPADFQKLVKECQDKVVRVITTEPQFPPRDAETLREQVASKLKDQPPPQLAELDPLETATEQDLQDPGWYERKMRENVQMLKAAFEKFAAGK
jgi:ABC-type Zn uptake system ZnuABC Zn-binding protein ZnuA